LSTNAVAGDTPADAAAKGFLADLNEALWLLDEVQQAPKSTFEYATRKADHIKEFQRVLYRLHVVLAGWEEIHRT
jgi:hypothetical protein